MSEFLKIQYRFGKVSISQLKTLVGKVITNEQLEEIVGGDSSVD